MPLKKLQAYVLKDVLTAFLPAFVALSLLMVVGVCMQLLRDGLDVVRLPALVPPMFAYSVPLVLPAAFLTAVIMAFGRLAADNELIAIRAGGVALGSVIYPVLGVAGLVSLGAAYLQFETVPRARGNMEVLEYKALQQILLDQAALSAKRQFAFRQARIQYDDFRDGRMRDVLVLRVENRRPVMLITAESATLAPHAQQPDRRVQFVLDDCTITPLGRQRYRTAGSVTAEQMTLSVDVAPDARAVRDDEKYMPLGALMRRRRELAETVADQPTHQNLEAAHDEVSEALRYKRIELADCRRDLEAARKEHQKYAEERPALEERQISICEARIQELTDRIEARREQQLQYQEEIRRASEGEGDYARLEDLIRRNAVLKEKIQEDEQEREDLRGDIAGCQRRLRDYAEKAARQQERIAPLEELESVLRREERRLRRERRRIDEQEELRTIRTRIHKRLVQAASVFVFALLGIPLGIMAGARSVMVAFGVSFAIVLLVFYPILIFGQMMAEAGALPMVPSMWAADIFTAVIGAVLLGRALLR